jgi:Fe-Mn family superoxide dismutase
MTAIHQLPELPYSLDALEPYISKETLEYHYGKHHAGYIKNLNSEIQGTEYADMSLEKLVKNTNGQVFNNAAQVWNHTFYWHCMTPGGTSAKGDVLEAIKRKFRSLESFETEFAITATSHFGSGWIWLVLDEQGKLAITSTHDADTPLRHNHVPLLACDVWEHAYYIDYRNSRAEYLKNYWHVVNWDFVNEQFAQAQRRKAA